jgi:hypothetical protein
VVSTTHLCATAENVAGEVEAEDVAVEILATGSRVKIRT